MERGERGREVEGARARRGRPRRGAGDGEGAAPPGDGGAAAEEEWGRRADGLHGWVAEEEEAAVEGGGGQFPDRSFHRRGMGRRRWRNASVSRGFQIAAAAEVNGGGNESEFVLSLHFQI